MNKKIFQSPEWLSATIIQRGIWVSLYGANLKIKGGANIKLTAAFLHESKLDYMVIEKNQEGCPLFRLLKKEKETVRINLFLDKKEERMKLAEEIYKAYPKKVGKPAALRAIANALTKDEYDSLYQKTIAFAEARKDQEKNFTPHPSTWFNQERYNDDPSTWRKDDEEPPKNNTAFKI